VDDVGQFRMAPSPSTKNAVHGDGDRLMPLECGRWYDRVLPDSRLEVIADAGHWLQIEHHDRFVALVRDFLTTTYPVATRA
jgi:pimeloyl-ACP methyl ester carboxylesterase